MSAPRRTWSLQVILYAAGAVLIPVGLLAIWIGWYGAAHAKFGYDQFPYLISGGVFGLGLLLLGCFLYFGAWVAKSASDQAAASQQIIAALNVLAERSAPQTDLSTSVGVVQRVVAGRGRTIHRSDCALIAQRDDLRLVSGSEPGLTPCRVCRPMGAQG